MHFQKILPLVAALAIWQPSAHATERDPVQFTGDHSSAPNQDFEEPGTKVEIQAFDKSSKVYLKLGDRFSASTDDTLESIGWTVTMSAPLNKSSDTTDLATMEGFANAFDVELKLFRYIFAGTRIPNFKDGSPDLALVKSIAADAKEQCKKTPGCDATKISYTDLSDKEVRLYAPGRLEEYSDLYWDKDAVSYSYGGSATAGYETFSFLDPMTFNKDEEKKTPWGVKAFIGVMFPKHSIMLALGAEYREEFKSSKSQTFCEPPDIDGLQECKTGAFSAPKENNKSIVYLEGRSFLKFGTKRTGFSIKTAYDFENEVFAVDAPIYLFQDAKKNFTGGVRFGWRDDTDETVIGVFVGSKFSLSN